MKIAAILIILGILIITAFWSGIVVRKYIIRSEKITGQIKIVLVTDLHGYIYGKNQKNIADKIKKADPDLILLGGDIVDEMMPLKGSEQFFEAIKDIADIYYVTGNHDKIFERINADKINLKELIESYGITFLENDYAEININGNDIIIGGADDPGINRRTSTAENTTSLESTWETKVNAAFNTEYLKSDGRYKILLTHRPDKINTYGSLPFDLILSGHAHGGQVRIPFILKNGLYAPNQGLFPKYTGGIYEYADKIHVVSTGLSLKIPRVFNPPDIVVVTLDSQYP